MISRFLAALAVCAAVGLGLAPTAHAQKGGGGGAYVTIQVCNNSANPANVAISYQPINQANFYNEGWYTIAPRACRELAQTTNGYFYGYAEVVNDGARYWSGDHPLCVQYPGPFAFWSSGSTQCARGQEVRQFVTMHTENWGVYTWSLDP
jgi:uncharacterized membrane protein